MSISIALANEVLQNDYLPGFQSQINDKMSYFYKLIEKKQQATSGEQFAWLARYGRSGGKGSAAEDATLPDAIARNRKQILASPKNFYGRMQISDRLIKASQGTAAFLNELTQQMEELMLDCKDDLSRQLFGDGTGLITSITASTGPLTTITVANSTFLNSGIVINIKSSVKVDKYASVQISDVNKVTNVVTLASAVTVVSGDLIYQTGCYNNEISGLGKIMTPGNTLYNIDRSTNSWFNPQSFTLGGNNDLDDNYMLYPFQQIDKETGVKPDIIIAGYSAYRNLVDFLSAFQRFTETETRYDAGHKTLHYNGVPVEQDKYQGDQVMDFLSTEYFSLMHIGENFAWMSDDGAVLSRVQNKAAYEATLAMYAELCVKYPKAQFRYTNIQKTSFTPV